MGKRVPAEPPRKAESDVRKMRMNVFSEAGRAGKDSDHQVCLQPQHEGVQPAAYPRLHRLIIYWYHFELCKQISISIVMLLKKRLDRHKDVKTTVVIFVRVSDL